MQRILVICTHNAARSQMAEGWLRYYAKVMNSKAEVFSAGMNPTEVRSEAIEVMAERHISLEKHYSKHLNDIPDINNFDVVITVCANAEKECPIFPAKTRHIHHSFPDPSGKDINEWRMARDGLAHMSQQIIETLLLDEQEW